MRQQYRCLLTLGLVLSLAGCSTISGWFDSDEEDSAFLGVQESGNSFRDHLLEGFVELFLPHVPSESGLEFKLPVLVETEEVE